MNMTGMTPATGGPVGGGMMMMNNGGSPAMNASNSTDNLKPLLNTYIYEYFLKTGHFDIARALNKDDKFEIRTTPKQSPGRRKDGDMNGADGDMMDMDMKDDIPDDLPRPHSIASSAQEGLGFLFEWFAIFSDLFTAHRGQGKSSGTQITPATQYLLQHQQFQRIRENQQNQNLARPGMMNTQFAAMRAANQMRNGMVNGELAKRMTPAQMQMFQQQQKAAMQQHNMPRGDQNDGDPNNRPGTPAEGGENGGSPSKRPRLEGQPFNGGMMPNGRPGVPGVGQGNMMIQAGFNPNMNQAPFRQNGGMPTKMPAGMTNGMMSMPNQGSPMMPVMNHFSTEGMPADMYNNRMAGQVMQGAPNGQSGNHALQDYQMQLMLLEQQNKKRLMMARQEQHESQPRDGQPMPGGVIPPGMSPSGSRSGTSPNPTEQMKRAAQMGGMPGSPSTGDMQGRSPAGMNFMNGGMPPEFNPAMFMKDNQGMMGPGGPNMRPPTSAEMNPMNRQPQQPGRMGNQFQGGQPMVQQPSQGQPQPVGTPGQRNEMPPPSAPPANNSAQRNNQPASPANSNAPPTPSQSNKANPKSKKGKEEPNRKRTQKKNSTAPASAEDNAPAATTPSTPITPVHPTTFNGSAGKGQPQGGQPGNQQPQQGQAMSQTQQMPGPDLSQNNAFPDFTVPEQNSFNLDFSTLENSDVLENFDFDSFLNTSADDTFTFDGGMGVENFGMDAPGE